MTRDEWRKRFTPVVKKTWRAFDRAGLVKRHSAAPILFFGDLDAYRASPLRVVTVGKNPSMKEFPADGRFQRFPGLADSSNRKPGLYLKAMSAYFREKPYHEWFGTFEHVLKGTEASYYGRAASTALHTDICSPVATCPTWSRLEPNESKTLEKDGASLWKQLLTMLKPQIVLISFKQEHLSLIKFKSLNGWRTIHEFKLKKDGEPRKHPYRVCAGWHEIDDESSLFVFGQGNLTPFMLTNPQKHEVGRVALEQYNTNVAT